MWKYIFVGSTSFSSLLRLEKRKGCMDVKKEAKYELLRFFGVKGLQIYIMHEEQAGIIFFAVEAQFTN